MKDNPKVICLVLTNNCNPWNKIFNEGAKMTWIPQASKFMKVYSYTGRTPSFIHSARESLTGRMRHTRFDFAQRFIDRMFRKVFMRFPFDQTLINENIHQREVELHSTIGIRTLSAFEFILNDSKWEYLWRANVSNYVYAPRLLSIIETLPKNNLAAGEINNFGDIPYLSGAGYLLSRDVVERVIENAQLWNNAYLDDVALGLLLLDLDIPLLRVERLSISDVSQLDRYSKPELVNYASFRCNGLHDRNQDILIMKRLNRMLYGS
jgi:hypothetical protein